MNASLHFDKRMLSCIILRTLRSFVVYFSIFNLLGINFYASFEVGSNFFSLNNNFGGIIYWKMYLFLTFLQCQFCHKSSLHILFALLLNHIFCFVGQLVYSCVKTTMYYLSTCYSKSWYLLMLTLLPGFFLESWLLLFFALLCKF